MFDFICTDVGGNAPLAFTAGQWSAADDASGGIDVTINSVPGNTTGIDYRVDGGAWITTGGVVGFNIPSSNGDRDVELRATNSFGESGASDTKTVTVTGGSAVSFDMNVSETTITQFDSIRIFPENLSGFDTSETHTPSGNVYKPQMHDITYFTDTGKTGDFAAPVNIHPLHKSRQHVVGPVAVVCFPEVTGSSQVYAVTMTAYEPSSGKTVTKTTNVTVNSADSEYPTTQTICINPNGDSDFTDAPSGAQTVELASGNVFDETLSAWTSNRGGSKKRFLFKGGATYDISITDDTSNITDGIMFGSYGTGKATSFRTSGASFIFNNWTEISSGVPKRMIVHNLRFTGDFNPSDGTGNGSGVMSNFGAGGTRMVFHACDFIGLGGTIFNGTGASTLNHYFHLDDCIMDDIGGQYPILMDDFTHSEATSALTGCRITRDPQSDYDEGFSGLGGDQRAPVRINGEAYCCIHSCDGFQNTGDQPFLKLAERGDSPGGIYSVHCNAFEGANGGVMRFKYNAAAGVHTNLIWRQNIIVVTNSFGMSIKGQGCSIDSNLMVGVGRVNETPEQTRSMIDFDRRDGDPGPGDSPNYERNNIAVLYKDATENISTTFDVEVNRSGLMVLTQGCSIEHEIGLGNTPQAPLQDGPAGVALFTCRNTGRYQSSTFDTGFASLPAEIHSFQPEAGSPALDARTTENFYPFPLTAQTVADIKGAGSEDFGCWKGPA